MAQLPAWGTRLPHPLGEAERVDIGDQFAQQQADAAPRAGAEGQDMVGAP